MSTIEITDPHDWRTGDHAEWHDMDAVVTGTLTHNHAGSLYLGPILIRWAGGECRPSSGLTVTREVPDIAEPTGLGAVVRLRTLRAIRVSQSGTPWYTALRGLYTWDALIESHGPAVAVLSRGVVLDGAR
jgi:hypothetical protein